MFRVRTIPALVAAVLLFVFAPGATAGPAPLNGALPELTSACALKSNGLLRIAGAPSDCKKNEKFVPFKPGPVYICVQPSGSTRSVDRLSLCRPPAAEITLPPTSGTVYFCVSTSTGAIRYVTDPSRCVSGETAYGVTPNDAAPTLVSTSPADGATHVATNAVVSFTWSEPVDATSAAITAVCGGAATSGTVGGSGTSTLTFTPGNPLGQGVSCTVTADKNLISDVDTLDPPDHPTSNASVSFTTDTAPSVVSIAPADGATNVAASANIVITFSEPVTLDPGAVDLLCGSFTHPAVTVTGGGSATITLDPDADLGPGWTCTVTVDLTKVHDVDSGDPPDTGTGSASSTFVTADTAPTLVSTSPADGATHVATTTAVTFTWSEPVTATATAVSAVCDGAPTSGTLSGSTTTTLTFTPAGPLPQGVSCTVTADASQISDVDTVDPPDHPAANAATTFTTDAAPALTSSTPADGATGVATGSTVSVTFSEPVTAADGALTLACDSVDQPVALSGSTTDTLVATPSSSLPATSSCVLTVHASLISDVDGGDPPDHPAADVTIGFTTVDAAPSVTAVDPADGATDVSRGTTVGVTFSEPVTFDTGAFVLECPSGTDVPVAVTAGGSSATLTPSASLPADTTCTLTVVASKVHDTDGIAPDTMAQDFTSSFTTSANSAPTDISLNPSSVAENSASGTAVGTLTTTDPDVGDTFTYSLVTGTGDVDNASFGISGDQLVTNAVFDFETKSSYSIRIRSTDGAGATFDKAFTVTVTDVNEAPTDITLSNAAIDENQPSGTTVGTLSGSDPDSGQTLAFSLQASGCGGTFADNASFTISGTTLASATSFDFETKSSYTICVRVTDNGTPALSFDKQLTITVNNVNDPPVAAPQSYSGVVGNTLAVRGTTASGPNVAITGNLLGVGATDQDAGDTVSVVAEASITSTNGGTASVNADGSFTYLPPAGLKGTTDTFTYHVTDGHVQAAGTATMTIGNTLIWYVDNTAAAGGDGRSSMPYASLTPLNGAGDPDGTGDTIFVYAGSGSYGGGLVLEPNQVLLGQKAGLSVGGTTLVAAGAVAPVVTNAAGNGITLASGVSVQGVDVSGTSADGINGSGVTTANVGDVTAVGVSGSGADGIDLNGSASGAVTIGATVASSAGRSVAVSGRTGGTTSFTGAITGKGIELSGNTGATVAFSGLLTIGTTTTSAFSATGGGTVTSTNAGSTLASTTGRALDVTDTTIGAGGLTFKSVSANGAVNGIRLTNTGPLAGLTVTGNGTNTVGGDASGGTIQNTSGVGVLLSQTRSVRLTNLTVSGTPNGPGISGGRVDGFAFANGTVTGSGSTSHATADSNIDLAAGTGTDASVTGIVSITNSTLTNAYQHGVHVQNVSGTVTSLAVTGNTITSPSSVASSIGNGIFVQASGTGSTAATVTSGSISNNTVTGFPGGAGIVAIAGNESPAAVPAVTFGTGAGASAVAISGNKVSGFSAANPMSGDCISVTVTGRAASFVDITNNGTGASPLGLNKGICINLSVDGAATATSQVTGNIVKPQTQLSGTYGISGGTDKHVYGAAGTLDSAVLKANVSNNTVSSTTGFGIYFIANSSGTSNLKVQNNTVAAPTDNVARSGIRVDSGTSVGTAVNTTVCLTISGNTTAGASDGVNIAPGISLRKQGTVATTNTFGVTGLPNNPASAAQTEAYSNSQNPGSASGNFGTGGTAVLSGNNFVPCTMPIF